MSDGEWGRLADYFAGECSADESAQIERWIAADGSRQAAVSKLRAAWDESATRPRYGDVGVAWQTLSESMAVDRQREAVIRLLPQRRGVARALAKHARTTLAAGMMLTGVLAIGALMWGVLGRHDRGPLAAARTYSTGRGQRLTVRLADGTAMTLAPATQAGVHSGSGGSRIVELSGQAYFVVHHDPTHVFIVRSAHGVTQDVGTAFAVRDYPDDEVAQVAVADGSVAVRGASRDTARIGVIVRRGQLSLVSRDGVVSAPTSVEMAPYTAWATGQLVFEHTPLREVVPQLARWYDVDLVVADSGLGARRLTATFGDEPVAEILNTVAPAVDARVDRRGNALVLVPNSHAR